MLVLGLDACTENPGINSWLQGTAYRVEVAEDRPTPSERCQDQDQDFRNAAPVKWYTFWVAALVLALTVFVFFGLVQCVEGGLQAYNAFYPSPSP